MLKYKKYSSYSLVNKFHSNVIDNIRKLSKIEINQLL